MADAAGVVISGECAPGYTAVRQAFARAFTELGEEGAATALYVDGVPVVDLWGGVADPATGAPWRRDTLVHLYSVTKPLAALALLKLIDAGASAPGGPGTPAGPVRRDDPVTLEDAVALEAPVALEDPVARWWPEFAQAGKEAVTLRWLLSHRAGLLGLRAPQPPEAIYDWERICSLLAAEAPWWPPGTRHGEHAYFYGHLVGEVARRVDGRGTPRRSLGEFLRAEITGPWGVDFHVGLTDAEMARCATVRGMTPAWRAGLDATYGELFGQALDNPPGRLDDAVVNGAAWRRAEIPALNGHATARGIARLYAGLAAGGTLDGVRLFRPETIAEMTREQCAGEDVFLRRHARWGLGVQVDVDGFGHGGLGGSLGWGCAAPCFGFAYVTARMADHDRALAVYRAVADTLGFTVPED